MSWVLIVIALDGSGGVIDNVTRYTSGAVYGSRGECEESSVYKFMADNRMIIGANQNIVMCMELDR